MAGSCVETFRPTVIISDWKLVDRIVHVAETASLMDSEKQPIRESSRSSSDTNRTSNFADLCRSDADWVRLHSETSCWPPELAGGVLFAVPADEEINMRAVRWYSCRTSGDPIEWRRCRGGAGVGDRAVWGGGGVAWLPDYKDPWLSDWRLLKFSCAVSSCLETDTTAGGPGTPFPFLKLSKGYVEGRVEPEDTHLGILSLSGGRKWMVWEGLQRSPSLSLSLFKAGSWRGVIHCGIIVQRTMWPSKGNNCTDQGV